MDISKITVNAQNSIRVDAGKIIYFDPFETDLTIHDADYIFLTHDHYDHMSMSDIEKLVNENTVFIVPKKIEKTMNKKLPGNKLIVVEPGKKYETEDFAFQTVAMYNKLKPFHPKSAGWCGYIVTVEDKRIYVAGDIDVINEVRQVKCDIALIPIGGFYTMNYKEAALLINEIRPEYAIPVHYGNLVGDKKDGALFAKLVDDSIKVELKLWNY